MKYETIVARVRELSGVNNDHEAEQLLHAVLGTLGENVYRTEERQLAAQLPKQLKNAFYEYQTKERGRADLANYTVEEFYNRVKARANLTSFQEAKRLTKAVMAVLKEAVSQGEIDDIHKEMSPEFQQLFKTDDLTPPEKLPPWPELPPREYHIHPTEDRRWFVKKGDNGEILGTFDRKEQAIVYADDIADGNRGDVLVIYNMDGSISKEHEPATREELWKEVE